MLFLLLMFFLMPQPDAPVSVDNQWVRNGETGMTTAAFMEITNNSQTADTLLSASCNLADRTEIHETYQTENDMIGMRPAGKLVIEAGKKLILKPRSFHIMLISLKEDLPVGKSVEIVLTFSSGKVSVVCPVKEMVMLHDM